MTEKITIFIFFLIDEIVLKTMVHLKQENQTEEIT
jgi:hypothetical protein